MVKYFSLTLFWREHIELQQEVLYGNLINIEHGVSLTTPAEQPNQNTQTNKISSQLQTYSGENTEYVSIS